MFDETLVKQVVGSYPEITKNLNRCSFAFMSDDGAHQSVYLLHVCHAVMNYSYQLMPDVYDQMITSYKIEDEKLDLKFFDFMKNRLYAQYSDYLHLCKHEESGEYYLHIIELSKIPANVLYNICICSRVILEFRPALVAWEKFCGEGLDPVFAFVMSGISKELDVAIGPIPCIDDGHRSFDNTVDLKQMICLGPTNCSPPFKSHPTSCRPCNVIWGKSQDLRALRGMSIRDFWKIWKEKLEL